MALLLCQLLLAAPRPSDPGEAHLSWGLRQYLPSLPESRMADGISVVVEPEGALEPLLETLEARGFPLEALGGGRAQIWCPVDRLRELGRLVRWARLPWRVHPKETTEGYDLTMQQDWHDQGVTGKDVKIAVLDVGFRGLDNLPTEDQPKEPLTDFSRGNLQNEIHGAAVTEIVVDYAPDASYVLMTFETDVEFCDAIETLVVDEKVDVINGSIGFDNVWHADGTSPLTACADWAVDNGVQYFAAAGNENDNYRVGGMEYVGDEGVIALGGETELWAYTAVGNASVIFRWSDPMEAASNDVDVVLYNEDGTECARSEEVQDGAENSYPVEIAQGTDCSESVQVVLYSTGKAASLDGLRGYLYSTFRLDPALTTGVETLTLPGDVVDGVTVGAYDIDAKDVAYYSSHGPTNDGRIKPDLVAPAGVSTITFGELAFVGTSGATPHATGLAALWIDATGAHHDPAALKLWMRNHAQDLDVKGEDNLSGMGLMQADDIPACGCGSCNTGGAWPGVALLAALGIRRRR